MSYLDISMLPYIFYFTEGIFIFQYVLAVLHMFGHGLRNRSPRLQETLDKVSAGVLSHPHIVFYIIAIAKGKSIMVNDDDPHNESVYLICLSILGVWSFCIGLMLGGTGFASNFFVMVAVMTELDFVQLLILGSIKHFLVKVQLTTDARVVNGHEMRLGKLVEYGLSVSIALGVSIVVSQVEDDEEEEVEKEEKRFFESLFGLKFDWLKVLPVKGKFIETEMEKTSKQLKVIMAIATDESL
nr:hypothetical protein [Tanacetum cinerariifolium]